MEIKYTIEILTKDIQDIEKLVGNLQNSQDGSAIELDLALSKLRNVYEILMMIKADRLHELLSPEKFTEPAPAPQSDPIPQPKAIPQPDPTPQPKATPQPDPTPEPMATPQPVPVPVPDTEAMPKQVAEEVVEAVPEPIPESEGKKDAEIIAEKFSTESSINENLGGQRSKDVDTKLHGQPIDNIIRNIGLNDRFLIIRELFDGDAGRFTNLVDSLERANNYQNAVGLLEEQFSSSMEHEGVEILRGLVKRRFISQ